MFDDLGQAAKQLAGAPGFALTAVVTLALGIGARSTGRIVDVQHPRDSDVRALHGNLEDAPCAAVYGAGHFWRAQMRASTHHRRLPRFRIAASDLAARMGACRPRSLPSQR